MNGLLYHSDFPMPPANFNGICKINPYRRFEIKDAYPTWMT